MKRLSVLTILLLSLLSPICAQDSFKKEFYLGAKGGVTLSRGTFNPSFRQDYLLESAGGVVARYIDEKYFGLQLEVNLSRHGWQENFESEPEYYAFSRTFNYLEIPFMTHIFIPIKNSRVFFNIGPQIGFYLSDSHKTNMDLDNLPNFESEYRTTDQYTLPVENKIDYGLTAALGYELLLGAHAIDLEVRYYFGFGDMFGNRVKDVFSNSSTQVISFSVGYLLDFKH